MSRSLIEMLPPYYQRSQPVAELERALETALDALAVSESDTLAQLWVSSATWGLDLWEVWVGLPVDTASSYPVRRARILSRLRSQGPTTHDKIASVVASFGFDPSQVSVVEDYDAYSFQVVLSGLAAPPEDVSGIQAAVDAIKPAHLAWSFSYELSAMAATVHTGGGFWLAYSAALPPMEEA